MSALQFADDHVRVAPGEAYIVVVEDQVPNFVLMARLLAFMGVQRCEWKTSGWHLLQYLREHPRVDLILMDICLPYEDGYEIMRQLRASPHLKDARICAMTGDASLDEMRRAQRAGFDGFLVKPFDPDRFPSQIRRLLSGEGVWEWQ